MRKYKRRKFKRFEKDNTKVSIYNLREHLRRQVDDKNDNMQRPYEYWLDAIDELEHKARCFDSIITNFQKLGIKTTT